MKSLTGPSSNLRVATGDGIICVSRSVLYEVIRLSAESWGAAPDRAANVALDVSSSLAIESAQRRAEYQAQTKKGGTQSSAIFG